MKSIYKILFLIVVSFLYSCNKDDDTSENVNYLDLINNKLASMNMPRPPDAYDYPVYPGMKVWSTYTTKEERVEACRIPTEIVESLSTEALIQAIWEYPFFPDVAQNEISFQQDFESVIANMSAYKELLTREDAGKRLFERYHKIRTVHGEELLPKAFEILFAQPDLLYLLCYPERIELAILVFEKNPSIYSSALYLIGRLMSGVNFPPVMEDMEKDGRVKSFLETSVVTSFDQQLTDVVISSARLFCVYKNDGFEELINDRLSCLAIPRPEGSFNYYIYPGMKEWSGFDSTWKIFNTSQIPEKTLKLMSTQAVIQAIWEYPFFFELMARLDHYEMDIHYYMSNVNACKELAIRDDGGISMLEYYRIIQSGCKGIHFFLSKSFEIIFSQDLLLSQLSYTNKKEVVELAFEKDDILQIDPSFTNQEMREITWFLIARTMRNAVYSPFIKEIEANEHLKEFIETSYIDRGNAQTQQGLYDTIITHGKQFIAEH